MIKRFRSGKFAFKIAMILSGLFQLSLLGFSSGVSCLGDENEETEITVENLKFLNFEEIVDSLNENKTSALTFTLGCSGNDECVSKYAENMGYSNTCIPRDKWTNGICRLNNGYCGACGTPTVAPNPTSSKTPAPTYSGTPNYAPAPTPPISTPGPSWTSSPKVSEYISNAEVTGNITWYNKVPASNDILAAGGVFVFALTADDLTGVGVLNDPAIPVVAIATIGLIGFSVTWYMVVVPNIENGNIPRALSGLAHSFETTVEAIRQRTIEIPSFAKYEALRELVGEKVSSTKLSNYKSGNSGKFTCTVTCPRYRTLKLATGVGSSYTPYTACLGAAMDAKKNYTDVYSYSGTCTITSIIYIP